ncbi:MAG TPA: hypothetical protein DDW52_11520 [Planctomycetaceae bacterium]|nr:hypothetical protein [Planctomycetaceae bacterium]
MANIHVRPRLSRRSVLRSGTAAIALPLLDAMLPGRIGSQALAATEPSIDKPRRFVAICATLGFHTPNLFPQTPKQKLTGDESPYLRMLADNVDRISLFSGLSHPDQQGNNGHASELTWLTSARRPGLAGFKNSISIDQLLASRVGLQTRFPSLVLSSSGRSMSWSRSGVEIPGVSSPAKLFKSLFVEGTPAQKADQIRQIQRGRSILDTLNTRSTSFRKQLGHDDLQKLEQYTTSVRDLEQRLVQSEDWVARPKPKIEVTAPQDIRDKLLAIERQELLFDMIVLALQTDSTRTITLQLSGMNAIPKINGVSTDWHNLSHHGKDPDKIAELQIIEEAEFAAFNRFLSKLRAVEEAGQSLLDSTTVLYGSNLGNASAHNWRNLPIVVAGGGFPHGGYHALDADENTPLSNLFLTLAESVGVSLDSFGSSTGKLTWS